MSIQPVTTQDNDQSTKASSSSALFASYHSQLESLQRRPVPYADIYHAFSTSESAPLPTLNTQYQKAAIEIKEWLQAAEMTVFGLEMDVEQDGNSNQRDVGEIEAILNRFQPNIGMLLELRDKIIERVVAVESPEEDDDGGDGMTTVSREHVDIPSNQIQSSWSSLMSLMDKVKDLLSETRIRGELLTQMEEIVSDIDEICAEIETIQVIRSSAKQSPESGASRSLQAPASPPLDSPRTPSIDATVAAAATATATVTAGSTSSDDLTANKDKNADILAHADSCIEALATRLEFLKVQIDISSSLISSSDPIREQYSQIQRMWADMKARRDKVSDEIKEARWLTVFDQVAGQVESMMESTERAVIHCKGLIDQIKSMVRDKVIPTAPIDRDHLYTIFKSFEAKHKYYAPAVNKMLNMLQSGIESRMTKNTDVIAKHAAMKQKWGKLKDELDRVEQDLEGIERLLNILDASIPSLAPTPLPQLPEKPIFAMRRPQAQTGWKPTGTQPHFQPPSPSAQPQRGRRPAVDTPTRVRARSPATNPPSTPTIRSRPWSPAPSVSSLPSSLLSPNAMNNYRSLSKSPSRASSIANSDKLRPWCPSTTKTSPSIPGIPYSPSAASTYSPRSSSSIGHRRDASPSPSPAPSRPTSSLSRTRSISCTPSLNRTPTQPKPAFSPVGSLSKSSTGIQSPRPSSPSPPINRSMSGSSDSGIGSSISSGNNSSNRRSQLKLPPPVVTNPSRFRQHSAPGTPTPQYSHRSSSPFGRESSQTGATATPPAASNSSSRLPTFSPQSTRQGKLSGNAQSIVGNNNTSSTRSVSQSRLSQSSTSAESLQTRIRRPSLGQASTRSVRSSLSGASDMIDSAYGSIAGSASSFGPSEVRSKKSPAFFEEPTSPSSASSVTSAHSSSSSSSISMSSSSFSRLRLSRFHQLQPQGFSSLKRTPEGDDDVEDVQLLPELLDDLSIIQIETAAPYVPARESELDEEFAKIVNANPIQMQIRRLGEGKYYFGGRMEEAPGGGLTTVGGKMVLCRLMEYGRYGVASSEDIESPVDESAPGSKIQPSSTAMLRRSSVGSDRSTRSRASSVTSSTGSSSGRSRRKVMVRVGGGWQDLDIFLLDHSSLAHEALALRGLDSMQA